MVSMLFPPANNPSAHKSLKERIELTKQKFMEEIMGLEKKNAESKSLMERAIREKR